MKIGIEAQRIFRPHKHGMDRVALELVRNLQQIDNHNEYFIFVKPDVDSEVLKETDNFNIVEVSGGPYPIWEQFQLPKAAKEFGCDLLHCTSNTAPLFGTIPTVTTVHDIIYMEGTLQGHLLSGATAYQKFGNAYRRVIVPRVMNKSTRLITVSEFEKANIGRKFGAEVIQKLDAVHNGVSSHFKRNRDRALLEGLRNKYGLPEQYILFFGSQDPRKNTKRAVQAYCRFAQEFPSCGLVLMNYELNALKTLLNELERIDLLDKFVLPGYVDENDLPGLYQAAELFLFPSLKEGFGIPIVEAMACGTPVITSSISAMPEVAGDAAHLVDPTDVDDILSGLTKIYTNAVYSQQLVQRGLIQQERFSWTSMAEKVLNIYKEVYDENKA